MTGRVVLDDALRFGVNETPHFGIARAASRDRTPLPALARPVHQHPVVLAHRARQLAEQLSPGRWRVPATVSPSPSSSNGAGPIAYQQHPAEEQAARPLWAHLQPGQALL